MWFICKKANSKRYYVKEVRTEDNSITWAPNIEDAISFHTESGVYSFINAFLKNRADVYLILIETDKKV